MSRFPELARGLSVIDAPVWFRGLLGLDGPVAARIVAAGPQGEVHALAVEADLLDDELDRLPADDPHACLARYVAERSGLSHLHPKESPC